MLSMLFMMSILGLISIIGLSFFGRFGNLLRKKGLIGSISRGMTGAFVFFIVLVVLIWTIGALLVFGLIAAIATIFGLKFKGNNFSWSFKTRRASTDGIWPYEQEETKVVTLNPSEWQEAGPPKKLRKPRKKKTPKENDSEA